jgi:hypothetical protein
LVEHIAGAIDPNKLTLKDPATLYGLAAEHYEAVTSLLANHNTMVGAAVLNHYLGPLAETEFTKNDLAVVVANIESDIARLEQLLGLTS